MYFFRIEQRFPGADGKRLICTHQASPERILKLLGTPELGERPSHFAHQRFQLFRHRERINQGPINIECDRGPHLFSSRAKVHVPEGYGIIESRMVASFVSPTNLIQRQSVVARSLMASCMMSTVGSDAMTIGAWSAGADSDVAIPAHYQPLRTQRLSICRAWTRRAIIALHGPVSSTFPSSRRWPFRFRPANLPERNGSPPQSSRSELATRGQG